MILDLPIQQPKFNYELWTEQYTSKLKTKQLKTILEIGKSTIRYEAVSWEKI